MTTSLARSTSTSNADLVSEFKGDDTKGSFPDLSGLPEIDAEKGSLEAPKEDSQPIPGSQYNNWQWVAVLAAIYSSAFLYGLDNTIVADIQAAAVETFGEVERLGWLGIGFPLGSIATILSLWVPRRPFIKVMWLINGDRSKAFAIFDVKWYDNIYLSLKCLC